MTDALQAALSVLGAALLPAAAVLSALLVRERRRRRSAEAACARLRRRIDDHNSSWRARSTAALSRRIQESAGCSWLREAASNGRSEDVNDILDRVVQAMEEAVPVEKDGL